MNRIEKLVIWLGNRQRTYADGLSIFMGIAKPFQRDKYANYLREAPKNPTPFDPHFTMLVNLLSRIEREHRMDVTAYPTAFEQVATAASVSVVPVEHLPLKLKQAHERIKEIVPLYASIHAEMSDQAISPEKRAKLAEKLCRLDDERRKLWDDIDNWSNNAVLVDEKAAADAEGSGSTARGLEIAKRIKRLKANIASSKRSAENAQQDGRQVVHDNAMKRIASYEQELEQLNKEING